MVRDAEANPRLWCQSTRLPTAVRAVLALSNNGSFGSGIANVGDLDGGGGTVIAVSAEIDDTGGSNRGALYLLSYNTAGVLTATTKVDDSTTLSDGTTDALALSNDDLFGVRIANVGDLDGGGGMVIAVGAHRDDTGGTDRDANRGALYLLSYNASGALTATTKVDDSTTLSDGTTDALALSNGDNFGVGVANVGDLDGGGGTVIAVGAIRDDTGGDRANRGALYLLSFNAGGALTATDQD